MSTMKLQPPETGIENQSATGPSECSQLVLGPAGAERARHSVSIHCSLSQHHQACFTNQPLNLDASHKSDIIIQSWMWHWQRFVAQHHVIGLALGDQWAQGPINAGHQEAVQGLCTCINPLRRYSRRHA